MSDSDSEAVLGSSSTNRPSSSWMAINTGPVTLEHLNSPDLSELDKKCRWMLPELVASYKQAAVEAAHPTASRADEVSQDKITGGISHRDILDKARGLIISKFPSAAKSRTNPAPAPKILPRFNSFSDIDNMALYADDIEPSDRPERPKPKRVVNRKASDPDTSDDPGPLLPLARQSNVQMQIEIAKPERKRKATDEGAPLEDTPPPELPPDVHLSKIIRIGGDQENGFLARKDESMSLPIPWVADIPTHKTCPSAAMNVSKKRSLKEIDFPVVHKNKKLKLASQPPMAVDVSLETRPTLGTQHVPTAANEVRQKEANVSCVTTKVPAEQTRQQSPSELFSDQEALFEQIISQEHSLDTTTKDEANDIGDVSLASLPARLFSTTSWATTSASTPAPTTLTGTAPRELPATPRSQADVEPSLRGKPNPMDVNRSPASYLGPSTQTVTCFRVAEALRIRSNAMNEPVLVSEASKPRQPIEIELFARINLTYRASSRQVIVFEDIWFPNKLPILRAIHNSWQRCEEEAPALLRENRQQSTEGGLLCRAVLLLGTNRHTSASGDFQGEVVRVRPAEWCEVEDVRSVVEPQFQES